MSPRVHVINYHALADETTPLATSPGRFRDQIATWTAQGVRFLRPVELLSYITKGALPETPSLLLTFDDGMASVYTHAFPILREFNIPACVYLVTGRMGEDNQWPGQPAWVPRWPLMSWEMAEEMAAAGIEFGAHTVHHPDLRRCQPDVIREEVATSRRQIEERLGIAPVSFAYPYGGVSDAAKTVVAAEFSLAFGMDMGPVAANSDQFMIPRLDAFYLRPAFVYTNLFGPIGKVWLDTRRAIRRLRGR